MKRALLVAWTWVVVAALGGLLLLQLPAARALGEPDGWFWLGALLVAGLAGQSIRRLANLDGGRWVGTLTAAVFGLWVVYFWQVLVVAFAVPKVLLPPPH